MRHFRSILYAVVLAPTVWVLVAVGLTHDLTARGRDGFAVESLTGLVLLLLGGAAYGILVFAPISPLGPFVGGLVFLVAGVWAIDAPSAYADVWPSGVVKDGFDLSRPGYGLAALLSVPMLLTVLSVRRWRGYEPPVLPIIGQLGRARGEAAVAGTPVAAMQTEVLPASSFGAGDEDERTSFLKMFEQQADRTTLLRMAETEDPAERTMVLRLPTVLSKGDDTTVLRMPREAEGPTEEVRDSESTVDVADEGPTEDVRDEEPTIAVADERPTEDVRDEPSTVAQSEEEPTTVMLAGPTTDEPATVVTDQPPTEEVHEESTAPTGEQLSESAVENPPTTARPVDQPAEETTPAAIDEPTIVVTDEQLTEDGADEAATEDGHELDAADERAAEDVGDEPPTQPIAVALEETSSEEVTTLIGREQPTADQTAADDATADQASAESADAGEVGADEVEAADQHVVGVAAAAEESVLVEEDEDVVVEETTYLLVADDDERARLIALAGDEDGPVFESPGERTVEIRPADRLAGETTQIIGTRGTPGETTRIIPQRNMDETQMIPAADDGERTQLITPGRVTPPGEGVEALAIPGERTTVRRRPGSIAAAESPNFADDPTGMIMPPATQADEPARAMTVMNMERPPDHGPEIPAPRKSPEDD